MIERSNWAPGPWDNEPDEDELESNGFACVMRRTELGHWCGYVGVPKSHALFGEHYDAPDVEVHGELTYAADYAPRNDRKGLWWFGFDCAHYLDASPGSHSTIGGDYRTLAFVRDEVARLAAQLKAVA